jgi:ATP-dependent RNA helicase DDX49/DBP8
MEEDQEITLFGKRRRKSGAQASKQQHIVKKLDKDDSVVQLAPQPSTPERAAGDASHDGPSPAPNKNNDEASFGENVTTSFKDLGVSDWLCGVLRSLGITAPTPVQRGCIPAALAGRDVVGTAQTGSGKTAAFALPILQLLARDPYGVFALVLTPTRELAVQLAEQFRAFGAGMSLRDCVVIGGVEQQAQAKELAKRPHVVVATPGRLAELIAGDAGLARGFARTRCVVG